MATTVSGGERAAGSLAPRPSAPARRLLSVAAILEAFLLALVAVAPLGGVAQSVSPLARAWPWLLWPARLLFGDAQARASVPPGRGWPALALFAVLLVGASCAAALAVLQARTGGRRPMADRRALLLVLGLALVFGVTLLLLPSLPSDDLFSYILYGRIAAVHHANPLVAVPADFPNDPFLSLVFWRDVRSVYGPVWLLLSGGLSLLAEALGGGLLAYALLFKLVGLASHLASALLVWVILGRLAPSRRLSGTLLYAWNPLCLLEFCASAHNDAVMVALLLLGVYCLTRAWAPLPPSRPSPGPAGAMNRAPTAARGGGPRSVMGIAGGGVRWGKLDPLLAAFSSVVAWEVAALVAFGLAIATKYVPLVLLPFYLALVVHLARRRGVGWSRALGMAGWRLALVAGVVALPALPYWAGPRTLGALLFSPPAQQLDNSLLDAISWPLRWLAEAALHLSHAAAASLVETSLKVGGLLAFALLWLRELRRARSFVGMLLAWGWVLLWYALVASTWFWPWYVTWAVAIVALVPRGRLSTATLLAAGGALTLYAFLPLQAAPIYGYRSVVVLGPAAGYLLWSAWRRRRALLAAERASWAVVRRRLGRASS